MSEQECEPLGAGQAEPRRATYSREVGKEVMIMIDHEPRIWHGNCERKKDSDICRDA